MKMIYKRSLALLLVSCCLIAICSCSNNTESIQEKNPTLDGKKVIFIGDSFLFSGKAVLTNKGITQEERRGDVGYFYQICKANGMNVEVTNFTYGGTGLSTIYSTYYPVLLDKNYDYVVFSGGRASNNTYEALSNTLDKYMADFRAANPKVKFLYLVTSGAHNIAVEETFCIDILNNLDKLEEKGITVVDWGKLVADIARGKVTVPGGTVSYNNHTFVKNKSYTDGFHPNQLAGYITAQMVFCAITGKSAVGQDYSFWNDKTLHEQFDAEKFVSNSYLLGPTNYPEVFASTADMKGIQQLMDQYLAEKAYRNYEFTQADANG
jgi:hypothetical protein